MNSKILYLIIAGLLLFNFLLLFKGSSAESGTPVAQVNSDSIALSLNKYYFANNVVNAQLNNNIPINGKLELRGIDNSVTDLKTLVAHGPKLIVRSNEAGCGACIENEIKKIEKFARIIGDSNIAVITTFSNIRKSIVFKESNHITLRIFTCPDLGMPYERESEKPFMFILNADLHVQNFYIPEMSAADVSQGYYNSIYKRYFKSKEKSADIDTL